jgi:peroxiredoxin
MLTQTPICDFGKKAIPFKLKSTEGKIISLEDLKGENGTLIMFICNHCPYVKTITKDIVEDCNELKKLGSIQLQFLLMIQLIILRTLLKI